MTNAFGMPNLPRRDDGGEYDLLAVACRPVDPNDYPPHLQGVWRRTVERVGRLPQIYSGSVREVCEECGIAILVGPRQQEVLRAGRREGRPIKLLCMICPAVIAARESGEGDGSDIQINLHNLGNPEDTNPN